MSKHRTNDTITNNENNRDKKMPTRSTPPHSLAMTSPKQRQGSYFEQLACEFLQGQGLLLVAQNWNQPKVGELDLVMLETGRTWSTLVFVEVRQRCYSSFGDAALSVTMTKQRKLIKTAKYFLQQHPQYANHECRFDVMAYNVKSTIRQIDHEDIHSDTTASYNTKDTNHIPEWLAGAFITKAW